MTDHDHDDNDSTLVDFVRQIVTEQAAKGWDLAPVLALVFAHKMNDHDAIIEARGLETGDLFNNLPPLMVVRAAAAALLMSPVGSPLPFKAGWPAEAELVGAMLIVESWAVSGLHSNDPEAYERLRQWVDDGNSLADHPEAYEAKCVALVTPSGLVAAATYNRDTGDVTGSTLPYDEELGGIPEVVGMVTAAADERHDAEREAAKS